MSGLKPHRVNKTDLHNKKKIIRWTSYPGEKLLKSVKFTMGDYMEAVYKHCSQCNKITLVEEKVFGNITIATDICTECRFNIKS